MNETQLNAAGEVGGFALDAPAIGAVQQLVEDALAKPFTSDEVIGGFASRPLRAGQRVEQFDLEKLAPWPRRNRGGAALHDPGDFAAYVNRLADTETTTVWADLAAARFTAVFNDHANAGQAGWRDHTATLQLQLDPEWQAWNARDKKLTDQTAFAEFCEQYARSVVSPDAATMIEVARTFQAVQNVEFSQRVDLTSADVRLGYTVASTAHAGEKGTISVPRELVLALAPYLGGQPVDVNAYLRWRLRDGCLYIGYELHRPDLVLRQTFTEIRDALAGQVDASVPVLLGTPPTPTR